MKPENDAWTLVSKYMYKRGFNKCTHLYNNNSSTHLPNLKTHMHLCLFFRNLFSNVSGVFKCFFLNFFQHLNNL